MNIIKKGLLLSMLSITPIVIWADEIRAIDTLKVDTLKVELYYRQGISLLDSGFRDNRNRLDTLLLFLKKVSSDTNFQLEHLYIVSGASPEGGSSLNRNLSRKRTHSIANYLAGHVPTWQPSMMTETYVGIDWKKLREEVAFSNMPHRKEVLYILDNTPEWIVKNGMVVDGRKKQLMDLHQGECWRYMERHLFPELRRSCVEVLYTSVPSQPLPEVYVETDTVVTEEVITPSPETETETPRMESTLEVPQSRPLQPFYMAVKTNLLYDALIIPNVGIEFYLGKGISVGGDWMYAWWNNNGRHRYWRIYGGDIILRKYFGKSKGGSLLSGHHLGAYGQIFTYDFETGGKGYMGGKPGGTLWEKMNYGAGLEYGYSLPIARKMNIDFVIGVGYWGGTYYEYIPMDNHYVWQRTKKRNWFGPTKAEISLVWLLGRGNYNTRKGGRP